MIKKTVKKLEIISLALMMTTSMLGSTTASVFAKGNDGIATAAVDESGYNVLGSVASQITLLLWIFLQANEYAIHS